MLKLREIVKEYKTGDTTLAALAGVSLDFRENEFVSILGPSGCGKTTLLNIVGGLDRYTRGDLIINGKSTKLFKDKDWDAYRNHSVGFVFQSYNLIPHQTVLANVELALTLSGVSKKERKQKAVAALEKVGLGDQLNKKPNQMSGGQMQRVAIARALVNNPDILLADEPTGALDTTTSVQIMDLLKEVAKDRLVIMVTHNPELAEEYSTRIIRLKDGQVVDDSNPITEEEMAAFDKHDEERQAELRKNKKAAKKAAKKKSMSFGTAISLSLKNLMTKKSRTVLTSFAGSIGIIGIALILALSNGIQLFIDQVQEDTLSTFPLTITEQTQDTAAMMGAMTSVSQNENKEIDPNKIYVDDSMGTMISAMTSTVSNDLVSFKKYLDENYDQIKDYVSDVQYTYNLDLQVYSADGKNKLGLASMMESMGGQFKDLSSLVAGSGMDVMSEMINNQDLLDQQYELVSGTWPKEATDVVIVVGKNNQISKMTLYMIGVLPQDDLEQVMKDLLEKGEYDTTPMEPYDITDFLAMKFKMLNTYDFYQETSKTYKSADGAQVPVWADIREDVQYLSDEKLLEEFIVENGIELNVSGIIRPKEEATSTSISGAIAYSKKLTDLLLENNATSKVIAQQEKTPDINVLTGLPFERTKYTPETIGELIDKIDDSRMEQFYAYMTTMIFQDPEFSKLLNVTDKASFQNVFFLLPPEQQNALVSTMLTSAQANNPLGVATIYATVSGMLQNVTLTPENTAKLLPILKTEELFVLVFGMTASDTMPISLSGLVDLAGEATMTQIYSSTTEGLKTMTVNEEIFKAILSSMKAEDETFIALENALYSFAPQTDATYDSILTQLGDAKKAEPASINFYAKDFESKDEVEAFITKYNDSQTDEKKKLQYSDLVGSLMSSVSIIIDVISYVLIAFVSISLVVSSIMIGIITNISVLERTKEIGILRAIGASKRDVSRVFNAETLIIGLASGAIGIITTLILCVPANLIIHALTGFNNINAVLPWLGGVILVVISMLLTIIAGLIPAKNASKKDPVVALRTE